jgi:hypothetical protein
LNYLEEVNVNITVPVVPVVPELPVVPEVPEVEPALIIQRVNVRHVIVPVIPIMVVANTSLIADIK